MTDISINFYEKNFNFVGNQNASSDNQQEVAVTMKDASDNESVGASISAETSNAPEITTQIQKVTAAPAVTFPLVTVTATQSTDEPFLKSTKDRKATRGKGRSM